MTEAAAPAPRPRGEPLDWQGARRPERHPIRGRFVTLEPLSEAHVPALYAATHAPRADASLWDYMPYGPFTDEAAMTQWVRSRDPVDPVFFALIDHGRGTAEGIASYMRIEPDAGSIEIGHILFSPALQRTRAATEAILILSAPVFEELGYRRLEWKCDVHNAASRRAAERFGFTYEGTFRQHRVVKGRNRDTAWFSLLDHEWSRARRGFEAWLDDSNFDEKGAQRRGLAHVRASIG